MEQNAYAVIMAGGKGERFWPLSTSRTPKQLLKLFGPESLLAQAVERLEGLIPPERVFVITNAELVQATRDAAPALPPENVIGEPVGRDTAAACACGLALVKARDPDAAFCVLTADHIIGKLDLFRETLRQSLQRAVTSDVLITIGITPAFASTGYGYIAAGKELGTEGGITFRAALRFVEKPDAEVAQKYLDDGSYYWNSGMFIWSVPALEKAFHRYRRPLYDMVGRLAADGPLSESLFAERLGQEYEELEKISIDYAVMENATNIVMAVGAFEWDDVGAWPAVANHFPADDHGNTMKGDCEQIDSADNIVVSEGRLTALIGVKDLVVIQADGATLVCPKDRAQDVKELVRKLANKSQYRELL